MRPVLFSRLEAEILKLYSPPHRRKSTWYKMRRVLGEFAALPSIRKATDITPSAIIDWLAAHADRAPMTNKSYLSSFKSACAIAKTVRSRRPDPLD